MAWVLAASDDFERANGAPGANWTKQSGTTGATISSGALVDGGDGYALWMNWATQLAVDDMAVEIDVNRTTATSDHWIGLQFNPTTTDVTEMRLAGLEIYVEGAFIGMAAAQPDVRTMRAEIQGTTGKFLSNGVELWSGTVPAAAGAGYRYGAVKISPSGPILAFRLYRWEADPVAPSTPDAPVIDSAWNAAIHAQATPPADGGSPITAYVWQVAPQVAGVPGTWSTVSGQTTRELNASGLTNGTAYYARVAATNTVGTSSYSAASAALTPVDLGERACLTSTGAGLRLGASGTLLLE
jgi:fibronectin type III domain protein